MNSTLWSAVVSNRNMEFCVVRVRMPPLAPATRVWVLIARSNDIFFFMKPHFLFFSTEGPDIRVNYSCFRIMKSLVLPSNPAETSDLRLFLWLKGRRLEFHPECHGDGGEGRFARLLIKSCNKTTGMIKLGRPGAESCPQSQFIITSLNEMKARRY